MDARLITTDEELIIVFRILLSELEKKSTVGKGIFFPPWKIILPKDKIKLTHKQPNFSFAIEYANISAEKSLQMLGVTLYHLATGLSELNDPSFLLDGYDKQPINSILWPTISSLLKGEEEDIEKLKNTITAKEKETYESFNEKLLFEEGFGGRAEEDIEKLKNTITAKEKETYESFNEKLLFEETKDISQNPTTPGPINCIPYSSFQKKLRPKRSLIKYIFLAAILATIVFESIVGIWISYNAIISGAISFSNGKFQLNTVSIGIIQYFGYGLVIVATLLIIFVAWNTNKAINERKNAMGIRAIIAIIIAFIGSMLVVNASCVLPGGFFLCLYQTQIEQSPTSDILFVFTVIAIMFIFLNLLGTLMMLFSLHIVSKKTIQAT